MCLHTRYLRYPPHYAKPPLQAECLSYLYLRSIKLEQSPHRIFICVVSILDRLPAAVGVSVVDQHFLPELSLQVTVRQRQVPSSLFQMLRRTSSISCSDSSSRCTTYAAWTLGRPSKCGQCYCIRLLDGSYAAIPFPIMFSFKLASKIAHLRSSYGARNWLGVEKCMMFN